MFMHLGKKKIQLKCQKKVLGSTFVLRVSVSSDQGYRFFFHKKQAKNKITPDVKIENAMFVIKGYSQLTKAQCPFVYCVTDIDVEINTTHYTKKFHKLHACPFHN